MFTSNFQNYFSVEIAKTEEQKSQVYSIRYQVYCDEFGYESVDAFPDQEEKDEYDDFSLHCLIRHKKSGLPAACVRLVPAFDNKNRLIPLPLELHCKVNGEFIQRVESVDLTHEEWLKRLKEDNADEIQPDKTLH